MDKALKIGRVSAIGSLQLFVGRTVSTVIMAIGAIILGYFISEADYGLYAIALIPATTIQLFQDWGVGYAITRYSAKCRAGNRQDDLRKIIGVGLTFEIATGLILTLSSILMANFIASSIFQKPESSSLIAVASITIVSTAIFNATQCVFVGFEQMKLCSFAMICQAIVQGAFGPLLVFLGYGALGALVGYVLATVITSFFSLLLLFFFIFRKLERNTTSKIDVYQTLKPLLHFGVPLAMAAILGGVLTQVYSFIMASSVDTTLIGNYRTATNFALLLSFLTIPITTVLFPAFSKLDPDNEQSLLKAVFGSSVKYTSILLVPATLAMIVLSKPLIATLYGNKWAYAPPFLALSVISNILVIFGNLSMGRLLNALGKTKIAMELNLLTLAIGVPLAFILIPITGILGVLVGPLIAGVPSMFVGLYFSWKKYGVRADLRASGKIVLASTIAAGLTYLLLSFLNTVEWLRLAAGTLIFLSLYLFASPIVGAINQTDIDSLRTMFSGMGVISKLLEIPLIAMERVSEIWSQR